MQIPRTTPPLVFQAKEGVVADRDNAGGHNQKKAGPITCSTLLCPTGTDRNRLVPSDSDGF